VATNPTSATHNKTSNLLRSRDRTCHQDQHRPNDTPRRVSSQRENHHENQHGEHHHDEW
jgi:hypothetical protein